MAFKFACNLLPKILPWHAYVQRVRGDLTNDDIMLGFRARLHDEFPHGLKFQPGNGAEP